MTASSQLRAATAVLLGVFRLVAAGWAAEPADTKLAAQFDRVPGIVIDHNPASSRAYIGSPSLAILTNGDYVASHDFFGPGSANNRTVVFQSPDGGAHWRQIATLGGQWWSTLFVHRGALYLLGTTKEYGNAVIRRSLDGGRTWTTPASGATGLLRADGQYHCAPVPVVLHAGRLWRAMERRDPPRGWGITFCSGMMSAPEDADLLNAENWTFSNFVPGNAQWLGGTFGGWLEGNAAVTRDGRIVDLLRVDTPACPEKAALVELSADGRTARFDPATGFIDFPGGAKKFTIRFDPASDRYWSLVTLVPERHQGEAARRRPGGVRNTLALSASSDLVHWSVRSVLLYHPDVAAHGFQYVDWQFDGDDLIAVVRTAYDDGLGGAHNNHDANFLTFHRWRNFRALTMADSVPMPEPPAPRSELTSTNSLGLRLVAFPPGGFEMGVRGGDFDELPAHPVTLTQGFALTATEVSNRQFEQFQPGHREFRGREKNGAGDDDPACFVSWDDAQAFCEWLSQREGRPYRLPTEAEWEFVARTRPEILASAAKVENWCLDFYGPYPASAQTNPTGYAEGDLRVTRGGPWRAAAGRPAAANRHADVPGDRNRVVGFRVVEGGLPPGTVLTRRSEPRWAANVSTRKHDWQPPVDMRQPWFAEPVPFVKIPPGTNGPLYSQHNHDPALTWCPNGDLLAIWYSTIAEAGRELAIAASRLRLGRQTWDEADLFWDVPDRNDHAPALLTRPDGTLFHWNGLGVEGTWRELALVQRISTNNGVTWSPPRIIQTDHGFQNMPVPSAFQRADGTLCLPCDAVPGGDGGTVLHLSQDAGQTWSEPGRGRPEPRFAAGQTGAWIAGIHAAVAEWDGRQLLAFGRGDAIDGHLPQSVSLDDGRTWTYAASEFPPIGGGQRAVLRRLREGPLLFISFANAGMMFTDAAGKPFTGTGMFAALSEDGGRTWPVRKLLTDGRRRELDGRGWTGKFRMDATHAEPKGYLAAVQMPDGVIHLISSGIYYHFNLAWLRAPAAPAGG